MDAQEYEDGQALADATGNSDWADLVASVEEALEQWWDTSAPDVVLELDA